MLGALPPNPQWHPAAESAFILLMICLLLVFMRRTGTQYSGYCEVFNCLTACQTMLIVMTVRTILKVAFEKAAIPHLFCPSEVSTPLHATIHKHKQFFIFFTLF